MDTNILMGDSSPVLTFPLTPLDQLPPRRYIQFVLSFRLHPSSDHDKIVEVLRYGLKQVITDIPYLTGKVCLSGGGERNGRMEIRRQLRDRVDLQVKDFTRPNSGWESGSYDELDARHMPLSLLDSDVLSPVMLFPDQKAPTSIMAAQANFIPGGLLLCVAIHHSITDGVGMMAILKMWAKWCRRGPDSDYTFVSELEFPVNTLDRSLLMKDSAETQAYGHKEYAIRAPPSQEEPANLTAPSAALVSPDTDHNVCYFSADSLALLKAGLSSSMSQTDGSAPTTWISTDSAIVSLLWSCVTRARLPRLQSSLMRVPEVEIILGSMVNGRGRLNPPLPLQYIGNGSLISTTAAPLSHLVAATSLSALDALAVSVRESAGQIDDSHIRSLITFVDRTPDVRTIAPAFRSTFGKDFFATSWADQETMRTDWGGVVGGMPTYMRMLRHEADGMCIVYPHLLDGGLEVLIGLHVEDMARLKTDEMLCKFASWRHA